MAGPPASTAGLPAGAGATTIARAALNRSAADISVDLDPRSADESPNGRQDRSGGSAATSAARGSAVKPASRLAERTTVVFSEAQALGPLDFDDWRRVAGALGTRNGRPLGAGIVQRLRYIAPAVEPIRGVRITDSGHALLSPAARPRLPEGEAVDEDAAEKTRFSEHLGAHAAISGVGSAEHPAVSPAPRDPDASRRGADRASPNSGSSAEGREERTTRPGQRTIAGQAAEEDERLPVTEGYDVPREPIGPNKLNQGSPSALVSPIVDPTSLPVGAVLGMGRYLMQGVLGAGGMGAVLRVFDQDLRRSVALKLLQPRRTQPGFDCLERFIEEAQVQSQLEHPNIMPVYDIGMLEGGFAYYTMKLVTGRSLQAILDAPRSTRDGLGSPTGLLAEGLDILGKLIAAVAYAHHKGVVHRDLKPENVMVGRFDEVLLMDWGLSKVLVLADVTTEGEQPWVGDAKRRGGDTRDIFCGPLPADAETVGESIETLRSLCGYRTQDGAIAGTIAYMSPEQACGAVRKIDARTDVWALGAILYTTLTGHPPHAWGTERVPTDELLRRARESEIPAIETQHVQYELPEALATIVTTALQRNQDDRYESAGRMLVALKRFAKQVFPHRDRWHGWTAPLPHATSRQ